MLTRLKTEMLVRQESIINQVSQRGVPSNSLVMRDADVSFGDDIFFLSYIFSLSFPADAEKLWLLGISSACNRND